MAIAFLIRCQIIHPSVNPSAANILTLIPCLCVLPLSIEIATLKPYRTGAILSVAFFVISSVAHKIRVNVKSTSCRVNRVSICSQSHECIIMSMKEIRFSQHSEIKLNILNSSGILIDSEFVRETIQFPERLETKEGNKRIAQKKLNDNLVLRVVYRDFSSFILVITLYPGRKTRYEQDSV
jgi:hypothetical protein